MTKQLKQNIKNMEAELAEMKKQLEKAESGRPQKGDRYWLIAADGSLSYSYWGDQSYDKYRLATGNCFKTKENAELWLEIQKRAIELRGDWRPDWGDGDARKDYLIWDTEDDSAQPYDSSFLIRQGTFYMPKHAAYTLIKEYGDKLKIWICGEEW